MDAVVGKLNEETYYMRRTTGCLSIVIVAVVVVRVLQCKGGRGLGHMWSRYIILGAGVACLSACLPLSSLGIFHFRHHGIQIGLDGQKCFLDKLIMP